MSPDRAWERMTPRHRMDLDARLRRLRDQWDEATVREEHGAGPVTFDPIARKADLVELLDALILRAER